MEVKHGFFLIIILVGSFNIAVSQKRIYIDEKSDTIERLSFEKKWRIKDLGLSRWDSIGKDNTRICKLKKNLYQKALINYIKKELETIINSEIKDSSTILIKSL